MAKQKTKTGSESKEATEGKAISKRSASVRSAIKKVMASTETNHLHLAQLLAEAYNKRYHEEWGYIDFKVYCEEELDTHWRKAYYFVDIWNKVEEFKLDHDDVKEIGWTKMKDIASVMTKKNYRGLMSKAKKLTSRQLGLEVKKIREASGKSPRRTVATKMILIMNEDEATAIMEALKEAKKLTESENDTVAFVMICSDWLEDKGAVPEATPLEAKIDFLEKAYGVKLEVAGDKEKTAGKKTTGKGKTTATGKKATGKKSTARTKPKDTGKKKTSDGQEQDIDDLLGL